ncbi:MAG: membrane-bound lytic murein transglycosylase F [Oleiphilaceae bacterium]
MVQKSFDQPGLTLARMQLCLNFGNKIQALTLFFITLCLIGCEKPTSLEKIQKRQTLHVITRNAPAVYFEGRDGPMGFEYELAKLFADELNLNLDVKIASNRSQILSALDNDYTNIAIAGMVASEARADRYQYSSAYMETTPIVVYRYGNGRPKNISDLIGKRIAVVSDSYHQEELQHLSKSSPELATQLEWQALDVETIDLMKRIEDKDIDYAIITSSDLEIHQAYYPRVKKAFEIGKSQQISWYFPSTTDYSLINAVNNFFSRIEDDGTLLDLKERYFGHLGQLNYVGARTYIKHINQRLPKYDELFKKYSEKYDIDWRLMASMGYQESHWLPSAVSPTGVRGLMMLTRPTAKEMGIKNRLDPEASIKGGVAYFAKIKARIPDQILEPDRTWLAMAAYNVGYGHLEDARILTEKAGKDPNKWVDVKNFLPLLQKKKYYKQTRYGYARGNEPVIYVQNIRRYYDVLTWMTQPQIDEQAITQSELENGLIKIISE